MKIAIPYREQARRLYYGAVFEAKKGILDKRTPTVGRLLFLENFASGSQPPPIEFTQPFTSHSRLYRRSAPRGSRDIGLFTVYRFPIIILGGTILDKGEFSIMTRRLFTVFLAIIALAVMTLPALAKPNSNATIKATFDILSTMKVGSTTLAPGHYDVVVEGNQAKFERGGKTVAEVPCTLKNQSTKAQHTQLTGDNGQLSEIQVSGKTQAIEFSAN
jgi:hypothetical protein